MADTAGSGTVLVVDDDAAIRRSPERGPRLNGFAVGTAADGTEALHAIRDAPPDVLVLDVSMPGPSGIEVCTRLRDEGRDLPVLTLSALDETADRTAGLQAGGDDHLVKPFARGQDVVPHGRRREGGELTRARRRLPAVPAAVLLVTLMAGCTHQDGASPDTTPTVTPSGYADMRKKVAAAESAAAAADRDARSTADR